jgi:beta-fructofuranosidase
VFDLTNDWVWDSWLVDDGELFHLFFLCAPRSLGDPLLRHGNARVGHATSADLHTWERVSDAVTPSAEGYDDRSVWTGCVVNDGQQWRMIRTGISLADPGPVQRIGCDLSPDLHTWSSDPSPQWPMRADPRWYEQSTNDEHWRDPWVVRAEDGVWHMYITARVPSTAEGESPGGVGLTGGRGVVGHATSLDLATWDIQPPLSTPDRFEQLEVIQVVELDGRWVLIFSCLGPEMWVPEQGAGGVWSVPIDGPGAPVDISRAVRLSDESVYVGKVIQDRAGDWQFLAFINHDEHGEFVGGIIDPVKIGWNDSATGLVLCAAPVSWSAGTPRQLERSNANVT